MTPAQNLQAPDQGVRAPNATIRVEFQPQGSVGEAAVAGGVACGLCAVALVILLGVLGTDLTLPLSASGDNLYILSLVKTISQQHWPWEHPRLGAPWGADWRDFPVYTWVEFAMLRVGATFTSDAFRLLNYVWLCTICLSAATAGFAFRSLGLRFVYSVPLGLLYALQPFTFVRNTSHFNLVHYLTPLLALACLEIAAARGRFERKQPAYAWVAAALQGLSYIYNSYFACGLLLCSGVLGSLRKRRYQPMKRAIGLVAVIVLFTVCGMLPSVLKWSRDGRNSAMSYKFAGESEMYGLKIRHMLTPSPEHPLPQVRTLAEAMTANFPEDQHENSTTRLGTLASAGLLAALVAPFLALAGVRLWEPEALVTSASALTLVALLLATVGGFGSIVAVLAPDIRAYNRIVVFIVFFSLFLVGSLLKNAARERFAGVLAVCLILTAGLRDQLWAHAFLSNGEVRPKVEEVRSLVVNVEDTLPPRSSLLQLPYTGFPIDNHPGQMGIYDHALAYVLSQDLRWSWGHVIGRAAPEEAIARISQLPPEDLLPAAVKAGYSGIWIDSAGYPERPVVAQFSGLLGAPPTESRNQRYAFFDIRQVKPTERMFSAVERPDMDERFSMMPCHVDVLRVSRDAGGKWLELVGWAAEESIDSNPSPITVRLRANDLVFESDAARVSRPDVASALRAGRPFQFGFELRRSLSGVPSGAYLLELVQRHNAEQEDAEVELCESGRSIEVP